MTITPTQRSAIRTHAISRATRTPQPRRPVDNLTAGLIANMAADLIAAQDALADARDAATTDPLTGLLNRAGLNRAWNAHNPAGLILIDLDGFKQVNDTHGHAAGDRVLTVAAQRLRDLPGCVPARLGGDEFVLIAVDTDPTDLARRAVDAIRQPVPLESGTSVTVGASAGVRPSNPETAPTTGLGTIMGQADEAMYRAKVRPDPHVVVWTDSQPLVTVAEVPGLRLRDQPRPRTGVRPEPTTLCVCGGFLRFEGRVNLRKGGGLLRQVPIHVDVCADCWNDQDGVLAGPCEYAYRHQFCANPEAAQCGHQGCHNDHRVVGESCPGDLDRCCGDCGCLERDRW